MTTFAFGADEQTQGTSTVVPRTYGNVAFTPSFGMHALISNLTTTTRTISPVLKGKPGYQEPI